MGKRGGGGLINLCAFIGFIMAAIIFMLQAVLGWAEVDVSPKVIQALQLVAAICVGIAIALPAFNYALNKGLLCIILFVVAAALYITGIVGFVA